MVRLLLVLEEILKEIENHNPYNLVIKGGTALSLFYLNHHRESEDLDFDSDKSNLKRYKEIEEYLISILNKLKEKNVIKNFKLGKRGLASTNRYHMKFELETYKIFQTKIDVDFVELPKNLNQKGRLYFYKKERIFITKIITFIERKEFKDLYDISKLLPKIEVKTFIHNANVTNLVVDLVKTIEKEDIVRLYRSAFKNVDLRFKDLNQTQLDDFIAKLIRNLRIFKNKISYKSGI